MAKECPYRFSLPKKQRGCTQHECEFFIHLVGLDPQTGQPKDEWGCTMRWLPILLTENAAQIRKAAASTDKVATEVSKQHGTFLAALPEAVQEKVIRSNPRLLPGG